MSNTNNISPLSPGNSGNEKLSEAKLMAWLEGNLSPAEQHEVEKWLAEEGMESDALEGLRELKPQEARHTVSRLNHNLRKSIINKKHTRRPLKTGQFSWIAIAIVLLLIVVAYIVIRKSI